MPQATAHEIVFLDHDAGTEEIRLSSEVPESIAFKMLDGQTVPVRQIETRTRGDEFLITYYGSGKRFLESTIMVRS